MKKITALALGTIFALSTTLPLFAIEENLNNTKVEQKTTKKAFWNKKKKDDTLKAKVEYINLDWWNNFSDPHLSDYIARALDKNHDMKIATLATQEYYQNYKIQFGNELPQATIGAAPGVTKMPNASESFGAFALPGIVSYEADIFLKNRDKTKSSQKEYKMSLFDERAAYISIASAVGATYFNVVMLNKAVDLQEGINKLREEIYNLMMLKFEQGLISSSDTIRANKALVAGQAELIELKKQREKALNQLAVLIGESPENVNTLEFTTLDDLIVENKIPSQISSEIIENRPDYLKAQMGVEKAGLDVKIAKKEFLPSINLSAIGLFMTNAEGLNFFSTKSMLYALGGAALLPIFTGGKKMGNLRLKKATYERVLQQYLKTNLVAIQEVNDSLISARLDWDKLNKTLLQQNLEEKEYGFNEQKYDQGVISKLDLIQFRENLLSIDKLVAQQKVEYLVDYIGLYKACGAQI